MYIHILNLLLHRIELQRFINEIIFITFHLMNKILYVRGLRILLSILP
jgi:hypothetical protein